MSCNQLPMLENLLLERSAEVDQNPQWQSHLQSCATCRKAKQGWQVSLALFAHLENNRRQQQQGPSWEAFEERLNEDVLLRKRMARAINQSLFGAAAAVLVVSLLVGWHIGQTALPGSTLTQQISAPVLQVGNSLPSVSGENVAHDLTPAQPPSQISGMPHHHHHQRSRLWQPVPVQIDPAPSLNVNFGP